ncbi:hypothetical protein [Streptomyces sp. NPDC005485]|uniref:hypothetical protein n=1 Tax=Streptomyces sp. NPDC005485 TaxID=3155591 RepID=UPI0033AE952E
MTARPTARPAARPTPRPTSRTPDTTTPPPAPDARHPAAALIRRRLPTLLAVAVWILNLVVSGSQDVTDAVDGFGEVLPLLPLIYVIVHQLGTPRATWPVLGAGVVAIFVLPLQDAVAPSTVLVALALAVLVWGALRGTPHDGRTGLGIQAAGTLVFAGLALAGLAVDPDLGRYFVAAGWFFHGGWDFVHLRRDQVVSRTFAEWCGVVDVLVAAQLLFLV